MPTDLDSLYDRFVPGHARGLTLRGANDVPLLTPQLLDEIRKQLANEPDLTLALARKAIERDMTMPELHQLLDKLGTLLAQPDDVLRGIDAAAPVALPSTFAFDGMEPASSTSYQPQLGSHQYEDSDWAGYGINVAGAVLKRVFYSGKESFRWDENYDTRFMYRLGQNARIALFSDFGTGLAHSWYIAKFMAAAQPQLAIHLGDVYYAGKAAEATVNFDEPLAKLVETVELWTIPGNHDYYSGGKAFFDGIDRRREGGPKLTRHRQQGSYFVLDSPTQSGGFRIIAIDGEYHSGGRYDESRLRNWLQHVIVDGNAQGRRVILLSSDEPYSYGSTSANDLCFDVTANLPPDFIDLWFWGNTHYCGLYAPSQSVRSKFFGACIGHGGFPYAKIAPNQTDKNVAQLLWVENEPRFPAWTNVRQDMGNNGFVMMQLDDASQTVQLEFRDWTNALRAHVTFAPGPKQLHHTELKTFLRPACRRA